MSPCRICRKLGSSRINPVRPHSLTNPLQPTLPLHSELAKFGHLHEMHVCDNVGDHLQGNVYARYEWEAEAGRAVNELNQRWYGGECRRAFYSARRDRPRIPGCAEERESGPNVKRDVELTTCFPSCWHDRPTVVRRVVTRDGFQGSLL